MERALQLVELQEQRPQLGLRHQQLAVIVQGEHQQLQLPGDQEYPNHGLARYGSEWLCYPLSLDIPPHDRGCCN